MPQKRLLLINSRFLPLIGSGETYTLELIDHFINQGWDVHLATRNNGYKLDMWHGCRIHYIDGFDDDKLRLWECMPGLRRVLDETQPDIVHVHNIMPFFVYTSIVEAGEFPTTLTIHNTPDIPHRLFGTFKDYRVEQIFVRQLLTGTKVDKLIVGSEYYLDAYSQVAPWIKDKLKAEVVYFFPPRLTQGGFTEHKQQSGDIIRLLFPSRIIQRKGIENAIEALAKLPNNFSLLLPSFSANEQRDEEYKQYISDLIDKLRLKDRIKVPDAPVLAEKMHEYYQIADITIMPSHYEGFGIAAVEAMSWGLPVVASNVGGLREIITDRENGLLVPPDDTPALQKAILDLANDDSLRHKVAANAIKTVQQRFDRKRHMKRLEVIYASIIRK